MLSITFTEEAGRHLRSDLNGRLLRIAFTTGCGGSGYRLSYADAPMADDIVIEQDAIPIALDGMAASKLDGAVITFDPEEDGYLIDHPTAATSAWCG